MSVVLADYGAGNLRCVCVRARPRGRAAGRDRRPRRGARRAARNDRRRRPVARAAAGLAARSRTRCATRRRGPARLRHLRRAAAPLRRERGGRRGPRAARRPRAHGSARRRFPHMGWNDARRRTAAVALLDGLPAPTSTSLTATRCSRTTTTLVVARVDHGGAVVAAVEDGALAGVQFHPERSGAAGRARARERAAMVKKRVIPCLDVAGGRVVKGVNFDRCATSATRSSSPSATPMSAPTSSSCSTSRRRVDGRGPLLELVERAAEQLDDPVHGRRRHQRSRGRARAAARRRRQGRGQPAAFDEPALLTGLADEFGAQAVVCAIDARGGRVVTHGGRHRARRGRGRLGPRGGRRAARASCSSRRSTPTDVSRLRPRADGGRGRARSRAGDRLGRRRRARHLADAFEAGAEAALVASIVHERPAAAAGAEGRAQGGGMERPDLTPAIVQDAAHEPRPDAGLDGRGGAAAHPRERRSLVLEPVARDVLAQGRDVRQHARGRGAPRGLRRRHDPPARPSGRPRLPHGRRVVLRAVVVAGDQRTRSCSGRRAPTSWSCSTTRSRAARKVGEEGLEAALAGAGESDHRLVEELADLWFHSYALLAARGLDPQLVEEELRRRAHDR